MYVQLADEGPVPSIRSLALAIILGESNMPSVDTVVQGLDPEHSNDVRWALRDMERIGLLRRTGQELNIVLPHADDWKELALMFVAATYELAGDGEYGMTTVIAQVIEQWQENQWELLPAV